MNAVDEMHEKINDWFGRSQNGIAESESNTSVLYQTIHTYTTGGGRGRDSLQESLLKNFNHASMDVINEWKRNHLLCFIKMKKLQRQMKRWLLAFDLISTNKYNNLFYTISNMAGHSGIHE